MRACLGKRFLAGLIVALSLAWFAVKGAKHLGVVPDDVSGGWKNLPRHLGIMFWGAYFRIVYDETKGFCESIRANRKGWVPCRAYRRHRIARRLATVPFLSSPRTSLVFALRGSAAAFLDMGRVAQASDSGAGVARANQLLDLPLYHVVMIPLVSWVAWESNAALRGWPLPLYLIVTLLVTIVVSAAVFYAVELPAIAMGKRLAGPPAGDIGVQAAP